LRHYLTLDLNSARVKDTYIGPHVRASLLCRLLLVHFRVFPGHANRLQISSYGVTIKLHYLVIVIIIKHPPHVAERGLLAMTVLYVCPSVTNITRVAPWRVATKPVRAAEVITADDDPQACNNLLYCC